MKNLRLAEILACGSLLLQACGGCGTSAPPVQVPTASQLTVTIAAGNTTTAGTAVSIMVTALGANGAVASTYAGTVHFSSSDNQASLPADSALTNGSKTFSVTLKTAGSQSITVTDTLTGSITGNTSVNVNPGPVAQLTVTGAPALASVSIPFGVTVTATDAYMNVATGYTGTVKFTSSDPQATLPGNTQVTNGALAFMVTFKTIGPQTITATDTVTASLKGISSSINVVSNAATHLQVSGFANASTRAKFPFTVSALDAANNVSAGYTGTVQFSSSDAKAMLPASSTLTAGTGN
jgi:hypothetical protein